MKTLKNVGRTLSVILTHTIGADWQGARVLLATNPGVIPAKRK